MHDTVYAFDADASPCVTYWHTQFIPSGETFYTAADVFTNSIFPDIGILGTPVIDSTSNTIYFVTKTKNTTGPGIIAHQRLHALNLADGTEIANSPVELDSSITVPGNCDGGSTIAFNTARENQRPGLALVNGVVYIAWASHGDLDPYHGWILGFNATTLSRVSTFNSSPNAAEGLGYCRAGIWMSGGAPAADAAGNLYVITGNGIFDGTSAFGDSFLKLSPTGLAVADWFTPMDQLSLDAFDHDIGAGGTGVLVDQTSGPHPHLIIGGGKSQILYLLDRTNMGHFTSGGPDKVCPDSERIRDRFQYTGLLAEHSLLFWVLTDPVWPSRSFQPPTHSIRRWRLLLQLRFCSQVPVRRFLQTGTPTELWGRLTRTLMAQAITDQRVRGLLYCTPSMLRI
jgi:hypothetical protein